MEGSESHSEVPKMGLGPNYRKIENRYKFQHDHSRFCVRIRVTAQGT